MGNTPELIRLGMGHTDARISDGRITAAEFDYGNIKLRLEQHDDRVHLLWDKGKHWELVTQDFRFGDKIVVGPGQTVLRLAVS